MRSEVDEWKPLLRGTNEDLHNFINAGNKGIEDHREFVRTCGKEAEDTMMQGVGRD